MSSSVCDIYCPEGGNRGNAIESVHSKGCMSVRTLIKYQKYKWLNLWGE